MQNVLDIYEIEESHLKGRHGVRRGTTKALFKGSSFALMLTRPSMPFILPGAYFVGVTFQITHFISFGMIF
jgi:hypothetical protein